VSGHERERLSAYLDDELAPVERTEVAAHLAACPECAAVLADLAAVDAEAARLPAEAPDGYFDRFPSRVVARLEGAPKGRAGTWRPPVWTWAAAAALLLAVVTPLTLSRPRARVAPAPAAPAAPAVPVAAGPRDVADRDTARVPEATPATIAPAVHAPHPASAPFAAAPPPMQEQAAAPRKHEGAARQEQEAEVPQAALRAERPGPIGGTAAAEARQESEAARESLADAVPEAGPPPLVRSAAVPAAASLESAARPAESGRGAVGKSAAVDEAGLAFRRLDAARPGSVAEWRRLGEAWRAFAVAHPGDRRADEARVRAIEASREAWLAGGEAADEQDFRRDVADYLAAAASLQKTRVERLLGTAPPRP
jgi:hypothetical protein